MLPNMTLMDGFRREGGGGTSPDAKVVLPFIYRTGGGGSLYLVWVGYNLLTVAKRRWGGGRQQ